MTISESYTSGWLFLKKEKITPLKRKRICCCLYVKGVGRGRGEDKKRKKKQTEKKQRIGKKLGEMKEGRKENYTDVVLIDIPVKYYHF